MTEFEEHRFAAIEELQARGDWFPLDGESDIDRLGFWQDLDFVIRSTTERSKYKHLPSLATTAEMAYRWAV